MKYILIIFLLLTCLSNYSFAQTEEGSESVVEEARASIGSISFFFNPKQPMTQGESIHLGEKDKAYFCVQLNKEDPRIKNNLPYLRRIEVTLEGGNPPQKIVGMTPTWNRLISPDANGCFIGEVKTSSDITPGKYNISEVDLWLSSTTSVSLREEISGLTPKGSIEVGSPNNDLKPPVIEKIETKTPLQNYTTFRGKRARGRARFQLTVTDPISGVDPSTLHVYFKLLVDHHLTDILESQCSSLLSNLYFDCQLYFSRGEPHLKTRLVELVLHSIVISDRAGNEIELKEPSELKNLFNGKMFRYVFYPDKGFKKKELDEKNENFQEELRDVMKK